MVERRQVNRARIAARAQERVAAKKADSSDARPPSRRRQKPKRAEPDPEESTGRRPGPCPLCGSRVAYDDGLRMNEHRFKNTTAECAASYREFRWMPETVEEGLPKRQRGGGPIPSGDLERMRRIVTKAVALHRDAKRTGAKIAAERTVARRASIGTMISPAKPVVAKPPEVIRCASCGLAFERSGGGSSRRCTICDPPRSTSVRAYRGGLPGLGRRS